jgi:hypothetical protein
MNRLKTTDSGGFPLVLDDIRFIIDAYSDAFKGILSPYGLTAATSYKLSGCVTTPTPLGGFHCTAGYIAYMGEVMEVVEHEVVVAPLQQAFFQPETTYDIAGLKLFEIGPPAKDTYEIRRAKLVSMPAQIPESKMSHAAPYIHQKIASLIRHSTPDSGYNNVTSFQHDWENATGLAPLAYKRGAYNEVHLRGVVYHAGAGTEKDIAVLPTSYRPSSDIILSTCNLNPVAAKMIKISTAGQISVFPSSLSTDMITFDGLSYIAL